MNVGVTGHRNLDPVDAGPLRAAFGELLASLPADAGDPTVVVCGMAAGADTYAAEEAMSRGFPVFAILAAPVETYALDFPEAERGALRERLSRCAGMAVLAGGDDRLAGYLAVRDYLVHECPIVVAFWDGVEGGKPAGTSDVVRAAVDVTVYQIVTPRLGEPRPPDPYAVRLLR